jgi:hypothetical protein
MNVTPIDRILFDNSPKMSEPTVQQLFDYIDAVVQKNSNDLAEMKMYLSRGSTTRQAASYHLDNVVRPQMDESNANRIKTIEKMMYFILGIVVSVLVTTALRQIERRQRK